MIDLAALRQQNQELCSGDAMRALCVKAKFGRRAK
jgi:hypothetical protein